MTFLSRRRFGPSPGLRPLAVAAVAALMLAGCGSANDRNDRALGGAGVGAASGAAIGALAGGIGAIPGALIGAAVGGTGGYVTDEEDVNFGDPVWRR